MVKKGGRHSYVVLSAPTILRPRVWIQSTPSMVISIRVKFVLYLSCKKNENKQKRGRVRHIKKLHFGMRQYEKCSNKLTGLHPEILGFELKLWIGSTDLFDFFQLHDLGKSFWPDENNLAISSSFKKILFELFSLLGSLAMTYLFCFPEWKKCKFISSRSLESAFHSLGGTFRRSSKQAINNW